MGGLEPDSGINADGTINPLTSWTGVAAMIQARAGGRATVDILQNQPKAILNWKTFNVGTGTTVNFRQQDASGNRSDWVALNRIDDPNGRPSQILGQINAPGSVYLINRNGVVVWEGPPWKLEDAAIEQALAQ